MRGFFLLYNNEYRDTTTTWFQTSTINLNIETEAENFIKK